MKRTTRRPGAISFARDQRARANELANDVWQMVRGRRCCGEKFRREYPIGPYCVDFCCVALKLVVEVDGEEHFTDEGRVHDRKRDRYLRELGFEIVRFEGYQVLNEPRMVRDCIVAAIRKRQSD
ncbi:endonuclease domain-containing protein [Stieleria sp. JC731]|uniref:endonuclease domain-containing protein n=1 Tax=Pirellulaceae TaxID=2691357 RepID=UPI001E562C08|nr:endonuclease domain-containing protein [Stieleria sp. JC731]MCC9600028.1 endonuclease domain-containing protein [Stieleria sp. JC731]